MCGHRLGKQEKTTKKAPYNQYSALESEGVSITWGNPADASALPEGPFDVVYENNGKTLDVCQPAIDAFKARDAACSSGVLVRHLDKRLNRRRLLRLHHS